MIFMTNNAGSSLVVAIAAADTEVQIQTADAARFPILDYPGDVFPVRLRDDAGNLEYALATARDGNRVTILRGREGTLAQDFPAGTSFEIVVTAEAWERLSEGRWVRPLDAARAVLLPTRIDAATFTIPGDVTALFTPNRALHLIQTTDDYGFVATAAFAGGATTVVVQNCVVDAGLNLVELGLDVQSAPKYADAANADTLGGSSKAQVIAEALAGTAANAAALGGSSKAQVIAEAQAGMASDAELAAAIAAIPIADAPIGSILFMDTEVVPDKYMERNGASLAIATYPELHAVIGTTHGQTGGAGYYNLPDCRGTFPRIWDHGRGVDPDSASRTAAATGGLTGDHVGTVQADNFKAHSHPDYAFCTATGGSRLYMPLIQNAGGNNVPQSTGAAGGNETRPRNTYVMSCIKYI